MLRIGEVSRLFDLPISTLRYYDKCGFFPHMQREGGQRLFGHTEIETIEVIECLKKSNLSIDAIGAFIDMCQQGDETLRDRLALFTERKAELDRQLAELHKVEAMLNFKLWYYQTALAAGTEDAVKNMDPQELPEDIRTAHQIAHSTSSRAAAADPN